jgi:hypothetical protein
LLSIGTMPSQTHSAGGLWHFGQAAAGAGAATPTGLGPAPPMGGGCAVI